MIWVELQLRQQEIHGKHMVNLLCPDTKLNGGLQSSGLPSTVSKVILILYNQVLKSILNVVLGVPVGRQAFGKGRLKEMQAGFKNFASEKSLINNKFSYITLER
uniref:Reverse transcriptase n=1 Tax=Romanomermis culicivorax TaxID=13658 RepID=A0A915I5X0_ROMCU